MISFFNFFRRQINGEQYNQTHQHRIHTYIPITYHYHHTTHKFYPNVTAEKTFLPDFVFLIDNGNELILVDTGMAWTERADKYHHRVLISPKVWPFMNKLEKLGIKCEDVGHIIFTHLHWDHTFYY